jgi:hypothetical protein
MRELRHDQIVLHEGLCFQTEGGGGTIMSESKHGCHRLNLILCEWAVLDEVFHVLAAAYVDFEAVVSLKELRIGAQAYFFMRTEDIEDIVSLQRVEPVSFSSWRRHEENVDVIFEICGQLGHPADILGRHLDASYQYERSDVVGLWAAVKDNLFDLQTELSGRFRSH